MKIPVTFASENALGLSRAELADMFGVSIRTITRWREYLRNREAEDDVQDEVEEPDEEESNISYLYSMTDSFIAVLRMEDGVAKGSIVLPRGAKDFEDAVQETSKAEPNFERFFIESLVSNVAKLTAGRVTISENEVRIDDTVINGSFVDTLIRLFKDVRLTDSSNIVNFVRRVANNSDSRVFDQLYAFCGHNDIEITNEGMLVAFKRVRDDYLDIHSGSISNKVGSVIEMPRIAVDNDPNKTCSSGLHACAYSYLHSFGYDRSDRILKILIDPADVVSVPVDYNGSKIRVCKYVVAEDVTNFYKYDLGLHGDEE
nr:MAG TPA: KorB domain [Caudoviricetes sp.]